MCPAGRSALNEDAGATCHRPAAGLWQGCGRARPSRGALWERSEPHPQGCSESGVGAGMGQGPGGDGVEGAGPHPRPG